MAQTTKQKRTRKYSLEFKAKAVQLTYLEGSSVNDVAEALDVHPVMLSRWRKAHREGELVIDQRSKIVKASKLRTDLGRVQELKKENDRLKLENQLLKKWQRFLAEEHLSDISSSRETGKDSK